jgi:hypothetical protein
MSGVGLRLDEVTVCARRIGLRVLGVRAFSWDFVRARQIMAGVGLRLRGARLLVSFRRGCELVEKGL